MRMICGGRSCRTSAAGLLIGGRIRPWFSPGDYLSGMSKSIWAAFCVCVLTVCGLAERTLAQRAELVVEGLSKPLDFQPDPTVNDRFYIVEQTGAIRVVEKGKLLEQPFLQLRRDQFTDRGWEQGLLGLAFDPDYAKNKRFYVNYTNAKGDTHISRFVASSPQKADPESEAVILKVDQPFGNHNGGCLRFGPDGMLYIGMGDGGSANDPRGYAQNLRSHLGKMLRIDVRSAPPEGASYVVPKDNPFVGREDALPEIWAYGVRNPWKFEFDSKGRMWIADVGQNKWEWVMLQPADSKGGENYGWNIMEGPEPLQTRRRRGGDTKEGEQTATPDTEIIKPVYSYRHAPNASITGGFFYEGKRVRALRDRYIYGEFMRGTISSFELTPSGKAFAVVDHTDAFAPAFGGRKNLEQAVSSFGRDNEGELYICDHRGGRLFKIVP